MKLDVNKLRCPCGCQNGYFAMIDIRLQEMVEFLEELSGTQLIPTSGHRCVVHNQSVGGASKSRHTADPVEAIDFSIKWMNARKVYKALDERYPDSKGIGYYIEDVNDSIVSFIHMDCREEKARWLRVDKEYLVASKENLERQGLM